jgi:hypothetical protein
MALRDSLRARPISLTAQVGSANSLTPSLPVPSRSVLTSTRRCRTLSA